MNFHSDKSIGNPLVSLSVEVKLMLMTTLSIGIWILSVPQFETQFVIK